jgi:uncharacterized membrane protein
MLEWYGTKDFKTGEPSIILKEKSAPQEPGDIIKQNAVLIISLTALSIVILLTIYTIKNQKKKEKPSTEKPEHPIVPQMESDEDKIIRLLKSAGGSLYQSEITKQTKFSRAKTSKLLGALENKGIIKRYRKGRDKIVTLTKEQATRQKDFSEV